MKYSNWSLFFKSVGFVVLVLGNNVKANDAVVIDNSLTPTANLVFRNGKVHTMDGQRAVFSAIAVRGNSIVAVGSDSMMNAYIGAKTQIVELAGRMVLPGFIDTHIHSVIGSEDLGKCNLQDVALSVKKIQAAVKACIAGQNGMGDDVWADVVNVNPAGLVMNKAHLDAIVSNRPLLLRGSDHHTAWLNSRALQLVGLTAASPNPVGGKIERDAKGSPTGFLKDPPAIALATAVIPVLSLPERVAKEKQALAQHNALGITSIQDPLALPEVIEVYESLEKSQQLTLRVRLVLASKVVDDEVEFKRLEAIRNQYANGHSRLRADSVKILADGVIEYPTQTAAMLEPYLDKKGHKTKNYGDKYFNPTILNQYVQRLDKDGFTVHVHSIGDATAHAALNAFEYARKQNGFIDNRHEITHLQMVSPSDFPRFAQLGVVANMQLLWAVPDVYTIGAVKPYVYPMSFKYMYPAASLRKAGAMLVGSSDWPVSSENPILAIETGVLRQNPNTGKVLNAKQRVSLDDMLAAYTINAAIALKQESSTGSLEVGKRADLIVLDKDLTAIPSNQIHTAKVQLTLLDGERIYDVEKK